MIGLFCCVGILSGCSKREMPEKISDVGVIEETEDEQYEEEELFETKDWEEIGPSDDLDEEEKEVEILDEQYLISRIYYFGDNGDFISENEQFWVQVKYVSEDSDEILLALTDVSSNIYKTISCETIGISNPSFVASLSDEAVAIGDSFNDYYCIVDLNGNDITDHYFSEDEKIWNMTQDDSGINIFTVSTEETYSEQNMLFNVYDASIDCKFSFSKKELEEQYGIEWEWEIDELEIFPIGGNVYYLDGFRNSFFVDTVRKKAFMVETPQRNGGRVSSDGTCILFYQPYHGCVLIDIENESIRSAEFDYYENKAYPSSAISDGLLYATYYASGGWEYVGLYDSHMSMRADLDYDDSKLSHYSLFHNGYAVIELENPGEIPFVTLINTDGEWQFEPIQGNILQDGIYLEELDKFLVFSNEDTGGFLVNNEGKSQQIEDIKQNDGYFYHVTKIEGKYKIVYWDRRRTEMLIQEAIN